MRELSPRSTDDSPQTVQLGQHWLQTGCVFLHSRLLYPRFLVHTHRQTHRIAYTTCVWLRWGLCAYVEWLCVGGCEGGWAERLPWHSVLGVGLPHMYGRGRGGGAEGSLVGGKQTREGPCRTSAGSFSVWDVNSERLAAG